MSKELTPALTIDDVRRAVPSRKNAITQEIVDIINQSRTEPEFQGESLLQVMTTYEKVIAGRAGIGIKDYIYAIKFCAYLVSLDDNYTEAYKKTFSDREFVKERLFVSTDSDKYRELTAAASRYRRSKIVVDVLTLSQVPFDMMFMGERYKAVMVLADRMENAKLDRDKINAAKELLAATKGPENLKIDLGIGTKESTAVDAMMDQLANIAARQKSFLESGASNLSEIGALKVNNIKDVTEAEYTEV